MADRQKVAAVPFGALPRNDAGQALRLIENRLAALTGPEGEPFFPTLLLQSPNGKTWRLAVTDAGALTITAVSRT